jgi:hypothetical protein
MKSTLANILVRCITIAILLVLMNFVYEKFFFKADIQEHSKVVNLVYDIPTDTDIIYIGESSNTSAHKNDKDRRSISKFIGDYYPTLKVSDITKPATHAGNYKILLSHLPKNTNIKTLIVTLNLRSFNAQWIYSKLETSLQKSMALLEDNPPLINRLKLSFKGYDIYTEKERISLLRNKWKNDILQFPYDFPYKNVIEWDRYIFIKGIQNKDGARSKALTELAAHFVKGYAFQIDTLSNPRIKDFNDIIELAKNRNWNIVFNLLDENTERAKELVGDDLIFLMEQNRKLLIKYFTQKGAVVADNFYTIPNDQFTDQNWTTEHYSEKGRKSIANIVAKNLKQFHAREYKQPDRKN